MDEFITDDEWDRIREFASAAAYDRDPEMLMPEGADPEAD